MLDVLGSQCVTVLETNVRAQGEQERSTGFPGLPPLAQVRREITLGVGGQQALEDVGKNLERFDGLELGGLDGVDRIGQCHGQPAAGRDRLLPDVLGVGSESLDLAKILVGLRILPAEIGQCRGKREKLS